MPLQREGAETGEHVQTKTQGGGYAMIAHQSADGRPCIERSTHDAWTIVDGAVYRIVVQCSVVRCSGVQRSGVQCSVQRRFTM